MKISVQTEDFDVSSELRRMQSGRRDIGAVCSFVGLVRDMNQGDSIATLELEHYPAMTEKALQEIADQAAARWPVQDVCIIHRVGVMHPAEQIVLVMVAAKHRGESFAACEFMMDFLKSRAPFWKKEQTAEGGRWVDARESDELALEKWQTGR